MCRPKQPLWQIIEKSGFDNNLKSSVCLHLFNNAMINSELFCSTYNNTRLELLMSRVHILSIITSCFYT